MKGGGQIFRAMDLYKICDHDRKDQSWKLAATNKIEKFKRYFQKPTEAPEKKQEVRGWYTTVTDRHGDPELFKRKNGERRERTVVRKRTCLLNITAAIDSYSCERILLDTITEVDELLQMVGNELVCDRDHECVIKKTKPDDIGEDDDGGMRQVIDDCFDTKISVNDQDRKLENDIIQVTSQEFGNIQKISDKAGVQGLPDPKLTDGPAISDSLFIINVALEEPTRIRAIFEEVNVTRQLTENANNTEGISNEAKVGEKHQENDTKGFLEETAGRGSLCITKEERIKLTVKLQDLKDEVSVLKRYRIDHTSRMFELKAVGGEATSMGVKICGFVATFDTTFEILLSLVQEKILKEGKQFIVNYMTPGSAVVAVFDGLNSINSNSSEQFCKLIEHSKEKQTAGILEEFNAGSLRGLFLPLNRGLIENEIEKTMAHVGYLINFFTMPLNTPKRIEAYWERVMYSQFVDTCRKPMTVVDFIPAEYMEEYVDVYRQRGFVFQKDQDVIDQKKIPLQKTQRNKNKEDSKCDRKKPKLDFVVEDTESVVEIENRRKVDIDNGFPGDESLKITITTSTNNFMENEVESQVDVKDPIVNTSHRKRPKQSFKNFRNKKWKEIKESKSNGTFADCPNPSERRFLPNPFFRPPTISDNAESFNNSSQNNSPSLIDYQHGEVYPPVRVTRTYTHYNDNQNFQNIDQRAPLFTSQYRRRHPLHVPDVQVESQSPHYTQVDQFNFWWTPEFTPNSVSRHPNYHNRPEQRIVRFDPDEDFQVHVTPQNSYLAHYDHSLSESVDHPTWTSSRFAQIINIRHPFYHNHHSPQERSLRFESASTEFPNPNGPVFSYRSRYDS